MSWILTRNNQNREKSSQFLIKLYQNQMSKQVLKNNIENINDPSTNRQEA